MTGDQLQDKSGTESGTESGEELLGASTVRIRRWHYAAVGLALVVVGAVQLARRTTYVVPGVGRAMATSTPAAPAPRIIEGQEAITASVASHCPTRVVCGVSLTVSRAMAAAFSRDFPTATVSFSARAFDAGVPRTYWQQIDALMPDGASVVLTEQRLLSSSHRRSHTRTHGWPDGTVTVTQIRSGWQMIANLYGTGPSKVPITAARRWVETVPVPVDGSR